LGGWILTIGKKGIEDCENEWPEHLITPEMVGKTSIAYNYSLTLVWIVWLSLIFLSNVFYGFDLIYLY
jgi:hypothetical protein